MRRASARSPSEPVFVSRGITSGEALARNEEVPNMMFAKYSRRGLSIASAAWLAVACESTGPRDGPAIPTVSAAPSEAVPREPQRAPEPGTAPWLPLAAGSQVTLPSVRAQVLDFARGESVWQALHAANSAIEPPASDRQYVLVRIEVTGLAPESWIGCEQFRVLGANRVVYTHGGQVSPEPALASEALHMGRTVEGWCTYSIRSSDRDLLLMIDDPDPDVSAGHRFVALDHGASLARVSTSALEDEAAPSVGRSALAPAQPGSEVVTHNWSVNVVAVVRGVDARQLVESANPGNPPPAEGLEFLAVEIHARFHGRPGRSGLLSPSEFRVIHGNGESYDTPIVLDVVPRLSRTLFPGGEHTGWAIFQVDPGDFDAVLRFEPYFPDPEVRYLALSHNGTREASNAGKQLRPSHEVGSE